MIKINKPSSVLIERYKQEILPKVKSNIGEREEDKKYDEIIKMIEKNLDTIIMSDLDAVVQIYKEIQKKFPEYLKEIGTEKLITKEQKACNKYIGNIFNYDKLIGKNEKFSYEMSDLLNVEVCPYCNRTYTTTYIGKHGKTRPQFDHFFAKSIFPMLAVSIYNLIPSCPICNKLKGNKEFSMEENIYPYKEGINNQKYFSYELNGINNVNIITNRKNIKMNNNAEIFEIEHIYQKAHNGLVRDLIERKREYSKLYIKELNEMCEIKKEDLKYLMGYTRSKELVNTSLGKLKNDIIDELLES